MLPNKKHTSETVMNFDKSDIKCVFVEDASIICMASKWKSMFNRNTKYSVTFPKKPIQSWQEQITVNDLHYRNPNQYHQSTSQQKSTAI